MKCVRTNPRKRIFEGRDKELKRVSQGSRTPFWTELAEQPRRFGGDSVRTGKSPLDRECVVDPRSNCEPNRYEVACRGPSAGWLGAYATAPGDFSDIVRTQNRTSDI